MYVGKMLHIQIYNQTPIQLYILEILTQGIVWVLYDTVLYDTVLYDTVRNG